MSDNPLTSYLKLKQQEKTIQQKISNIYSRMSLLKKQHEKEIYELQTEKEVFEIHLEEVQESLEKMESEHVDDNR